MASPPRIKEFSRRKNLGERKNWKCSWGNCRVLGRSLLFILICLPESSLREVRVPVQGLRWIFEVRRNKAVKYTGQRRENETERAYCHLRLANWPSIGLG